MKILVTGTAGFIGFHVAQQLINRGDVVVGLDSINEYYDQNMKYDRLELHGIARQSIAYNTLTQSGQYSNYSFIQLKLEDGEKLNQLFADSGFDMVVNLAAQAGVRYSISNPKAYIDSNIVGFTNLIEACRHYAIKHLVYASSSSVYGLNETVPFTTSLNVDHPISLYAATKKSNELTAHVYSHLFKLPTTGLRFFTVYGPWGRPDMALFLFTKAILQGEPINVFNDGNMLRDFTFVHDIVQGVVKVLDTPAQSNHLWNGQSPDPSSSTAPYRIFNLGNSKPINLIDFIVAIENELGIEAKKNLLPRQPGDVLHTYADTSDLVEYINYKPDTDLKIGVKQFVDWYRDYFKV